MNYFFIVSFMKRSVNLYVQKEKTVIYCWINRQYNHGDYKFHKTVKMIS